jgi:hypothetical protein
MALIVSSLTVVRDEGLGGFGRLCSDALDGVNSFSIFSCGLNSGQPVVLAQDNCRRRLEVFRPGVPFSTAGSNMLSMSSQTC